MATPQPTNRNLLIPKKGQGHPGYKTDMQTLEVWARQPIQQLVAGSGITLTPSSGLATTTGTGPNPITISSTGGAAPGAFQTANQPDQVGANQVVMFGPASLAANLVINVYPNLTTWWLFQDTDNGDTTGFGMGWIAQIGGTSQYSAVLLPYIIAPTFTGATTITVLGLTIAATSTDGTQYAAATYNSGVSGDALNLTSGEAYQGRYADFHTSSTTSGGDLTLVDATGPPGSNSSGNGWVSAAGTFTYFGSMWGQVEYSGAVF